MRIPVYRAEGRRSLEAPGRSIGARMNAQPFMQAALQSGNTVTEMANQVGEYAATRYKVLTQNKLSEALLGAEETLRTRVRELAQSNEYGQALDGDDPIWTRETEQIRNQLRDKIGRDRFALQEFDARFGQLELSQRFSLRGAIDARISADANAARTQSLQRFEDTIAQTPDLASIDLASLNISTEGQRWALSGAGNREALTQQEYEALKRGVYRRVQSLADTSDSPENVIEGLRVAFRNNNPESVAPDALAAYGLLARLNLSDREAVLRSVGTDISFFNAPTEEEKALRRQAAARGEVASQQAAALADQLAAGVPVPDDAVAAARAELEAAAPFMDDEAKIAQANANLSNLEMISGVAKTMNRVANPEYVREQIQRIRSGGLRGDGVEGIDTDRERSLLNFLEKYEANMSAAIKDGGILEWAQQTNSVPVSPVDLSPDAIATAQTGLLQRRTDMQNVASHYNIPIGSVPVFTKIEAQSIVEGLEGVSVETALATIGSVQTSLGSMAARGIEELRAAGLPPEYTEMMYLNNPLVQRELVQIAGTDVKDLKQGLESTVPRDVQTELDVTLADYRIAFTGGGDAQADAIFNEQYAVAEKLALYRIRRQGVSAAEAVETVVKDLLPPETNWLNSTQMRVIVPKNFDGGQVETGLGLMLADEEFVRAYAGQELVPLDNPALPDFADEAVSVASLSSNGIWLNNSTGDGVVLHYNINNQYFPAMIKNRAGEMEPFEIMFSTAAGYKGSTAGGDLRGIGTEMVAP